MHGLQTCNGISVYEIEFAVPIVVYDCLNSNSEFKYWTISEINELNNY